MKDKPFYFKQFKVHHHRSSMKVGTDALLLGAWCDVEGKSNILEVGCGCGVISLMLAQRNLLAKIRAIDIDSASIEEASTNFITSPWKDRLKAQLLDFNDLTEDHKLDLIVCNPPFFFNALESPINSRNNARHLKKFERALFFMKCREISSDQGNIALIVPFEDVRTWMNTAALYAWFVCRQMEVKDTKDKDSKRMLIEFSKEPVQLNIDTLILKDNEAFSKDYVQLLNEFQIIF